MVELHAKFLGFIFLLTGTIYDKKFHLRDLQSGESPRKEREITKVGIYSNIQSLTPVSRMSIDGLNFRSLEPVQDLDRVRGIHKLL